MGLSDRIKALMPTWDYKGNTLAVMPSQSMGEWLHYLEFIETYFRNRGIKKPMIVEIGIGYGKTKEFYEEFLGYNHIGIDINAKRNPDIVGDSNKLSTLRKLRKELDKRDVNLVYLDGLHLYKAIKRDYELYAPLAKNIIVIHDIVLEVLQSSTGRFWKELMVEAARSQVQDKTFITLTGYYTIRNETEYSFGQGTGLILIEEG